jgi:hypothetical protein
MSDGELGTEASTSFQNPRTPDEESRHRSQWMQDGLWLANRAGERGDAQGVFIQDCEWAAR